MSTPLVQARNAQSSMEGWASAVTVLGVIAAGAWAVLGFKAIPGGEDGFSGAAGAATYYCFMLCAATLLGALYAAGQCRALAVIIGLLVEQRAAEQPKP